MIANRLHSRILATALLLAGMAPAIPGNTQTLIYKSVDEQGRVSFGDRPIANAVTVEEISLAPLAARSVEPASEEYIERLVATTQRLREDRLAREEQRAEAARQQARIFPDYSAYPPTYPPEFRSWGVSRGYPGRGLLHYPRPPFRFDHSGGLGEYGGIRPPHIKPHHFPHRNLPHRNRPGLAEPPRRLLRSASQ